MWDVGPIQLTSSEDVEKNSCSAFGTEESKQWWEKVQVFVTSFSSIHYWMIRDRRNRPDKLLLFIETDGIIKRKF